MLTIALLIGLVATYAANHYINERIALAEATIKGQHKMVRLVVANTDLDAHQRIDTNSVSVRPIPADYAHTEAVTPEEYDKADQQRLAFPLKKGEALLWAHLEKGKHPTFSGNLNVGARAITFPVDEVNSFSGLLRPQDKIDLIVSLKQGTKDVTFALLQNVPVLATGQVLATRGTGEEAKERMYTTITLETTPENANRIILARDSGKLTAVLRNPEDSAELDVKKMDVSSLLGDVSGGQSVDIIYGGRGGGK